MSIDLKNYIPVQVPAEFHKLVDLTVLRVIVEGEEYIRCEESAKEMWSHKKKGLWGKGYINTPDDPYRVERTGRLGEMAFAKVTEAPIDLTYIEGGDKHDMIMFGKTINVKAAVKLYGVIMVRCQGSTGRTVPLKSDFYVFSYVSHDDRKNQRAVVNILGFLSNSELKSKPKVPKADWINYECPYSEIHTMDELLSVSV